MEKKFFTMIVVAALAVTLGLIIVSKEAREPLLREILSQQAALLDGQKNLDAKLAKNIAAGHDTAKIAVLENRITNLENQLNGIIEFFKKAQAVNPQAAGPGPQQAGPPPEDFNKVHNIEIGDSYVKGDKNAPITIVEFMDFQCPFCSRFHTPVEEVLKAYPKQVKAVLKNFPLSFHQNARPAAKAALAAGMQGKYFEMAEKLLNNQKDLSDAKYLEWAKEIGLNVEKFTNDLKNNDAKFEDIISKDMNLGVQVGVQGTPTFYLNGRKTLARDFNAYKVEIDRILSAK